MVTLARARPLSGVRIHPLLTLIVIGSRIAPLASIPCSRVSLVLVLLAPIVP